MLSLPSSNDPLDVLDPLPLVVVVVVELDTLGLAVDTVGVELFGLTTFTLQSWLVVTLLDKMTPELAKSLITSQFTEIFAGQLVDIRFFVKYPCSRQVWSTHLGLIPPVMLVELELMQEHKSFKLTVPTVPVECCAHVLVTRLSHVGD